MGMNQVAKGRGGAGLIGAQMGCQLPLTYVHAVNYMVKFGNVILTIQQGYLLAKKIFYPDPMKPVKIFDGTTNTWADAPPTDQGSLPLHYVVWILSSLFMVLVMTTLYNAMLVVAASLSNPFNQDRLSFPGLWYEKGVDEDGRFFHNMALNKPWKYTQKFKPIATAQSGIKDDATSDSTVQDGPQDLQTLIHQMSKYGSQKNSRRDSGRSKNDSGRDHSDSPNNAAGGKGQYSPYNTLKVA